MKIGPIETKYRGCRFRSRTEARYAVMFDALGWPWEYERQGYSLPSGCYLPDFWLPLNIDMGLCSDGDWTTSDDHFWFPNSDDVHQKSCWVEIKGVSPNHHEKALAQELEELTNIPVFFGIGMPCQEGPMFYWRTHGLYLSSLDKPTSFVSHVSHKFNYQDDFLYAINAGRRARFEDMEGL